MGLRPSREITILVGAVNMRSWQFCPESELNFVLSLNVSIPVCLFVGVKGRVDKMRRFFLPTSFNQNQ